MPCDPMQSPHHAGPIATPQDLYTTMSLAFAQYSEIVELTAIDNEAARSRLHALEEQCHSRGLFGHHFLHLLRMFQAQIGWERMVPDEFTRFYRFVFHLCKQPNRRHMQVDVAVEAWRLLLALRFRLLDKWCDYITLHKPTLKVINEDQWRQVLEFSRAVHEDLSNYDPNGAWACFLDDFVEHMRCHRQPSRSYSSMDDDRHLGGTFLERPDLGMGVGMPVSPRPGSKRRSPDVDVVLERLSAFPLPSTASEDVMTDSDQPHQPHQPHQPLQPHQPHQAVQHQPLQSYHHQQPGSATKRHCSDSPALRLSPAAGPAAGAAAVVGLGIPGGGAGVGGCLGLVHSPGLVLESPQAFTFELPMLTVSARRHIRPRRSNMSELVHHTVSGALFLNNE